MLNYRFIYSQISLDAVLSLWNALEPRAISSFFLSSSWVETWLRGLDDSLPHVLQVWQDETLVALGLFTCQRETRHGVIRSNVLRLARTGDPKEDQIWIEYNNLLIDSDHQDSVPGAAMAYLLTQDFWDEFELGAADTQVCEQFALPSLSRVIRWSSPAFGVNLKSLRGQHTTYLAHLSRNTRHQITRSQRLYDALGRLHFSCVNDRFAIDRILPELGLLHIQRWGTTQSGFSNTKFVDFHKRLIEIAAPKGMIEVCELRLDNELVGGLYNFLYRGRVYFYLSGLRNEPDNRLKPGLLLHALAIQHYMEQGYDFYDFMGGDAQYKQSLATMHCDLQLISLQRPRFWLRSEQQLRKLKHLIKCKNFNDIF